MAFTTIPGSGGAPDSFVGTSAVDAIAFTASRANYFLGAKEADDVVSWVGAENAPIIVTNATVSGGAGNDLFVATETIFASVFFNGNAGSDTFKFWPGPSALLGCTLQGGQGNDYIDVDAAAISIINGNLGDDLIFVGGSSLPFFPDEPDDSVVSNTSIYGGQGNDTIKLYGEITNNLIDGGLGDDTINGSAASGFAAYGNEGNDNLHGGDGDDHLHGDIGNDTIHGGQGADNLIGGVGNDNILGGQGNDTITGGQGADTMTGGADEADDTFVLNTGDSFAATAGIGNAALFGNGVDWITDFENGTPQAPYDSIVFNGVELSLADRSVIGFASIANGAYRIDVASKNGIYVVLGNYDAEAQVFTDTFTNEPAPPDNDSIFFSSTATSGSLGVGSVEAFVVTLTPVPTVPL